MINVPLYGVYFFALFFKEQTPDMLCIVREGGSGKHSFSETVLTGGADMRVKVTLACTECKQRNYNTKKNKKNDPDRLEMNKYCKFCKKHTLHRETK